MYDLQGGDTVQIYDGYNNPNIKSFLMEGLSPGHSYAFAIRAWNFNGAGAESALIVHKACTAPTG
jgi:hypothetical protein